MEMVLDSNVNKWSVKMEGSNFLFKEKKYFVKQKVILCPGVKEVSNAQTISSLTVSMNTVVIGVAPKLCAFKELVLFLNVKKQSIFVFSVQEFLPI